MHLQCKRPGFNPRARKISWRRKWQPTLVFFPGEFHGQSSLVGHSPWGHKVSDRTEWLTLNFTFSLSCVCVCIHSHHHTHSKGCWEFPGGPVVRTLCFHCRETGSIPGCRTKIKNFLKAQCATTGGLWGRDQRIFTFAWGCSWWWFKEKRQLWDHPGNYNVGWVLHGIQRWLLIFRCSNSKVLVTYF